METVKPGSKALVTGITGQLGSYLTELLVAKGCEVHGIVRNPASLLKYEYRGLYKDVQLHYADIEDYALFANIIRETRPDQVYHLAARSHVSLSWQKPNETFGVNITGLTNLLEAVREAGLCFHTRVLVAGSSEMFGQASCLPLTEQTPIAPRTPYAISKATSFWLAACWRRQYSMFVSTAILFNHESPRRSSEFTTYQWATAVARVHLRRQPVVEVLSLDYLRDWGHAADGVDCLFRALQHSEADEFVVSTGEGRSPRQFIQTAFESLGVAIRWNGAGVDEVGIAATTDEIVVRVQGTVTHQLPHSQMGDSTKAKKVLGWKPSRSFETLVQEMIQAAFEREGQSVCC